MGVTQNNEQSLRFLLLPLPVPLNLSKSSVPFSPFRQPLNRLSL
ncbi:hypothetical protein VSP9026_00001 [Vibrio spartinae]|uniref:Uncharacterized protein n=1 Tax=Vibrio spartinae TaxID=1918945 RepID=A0A1N6LYZ0_9VIBR|nr:hypothetical protein VSP9026_00001 [Vibrio spartinae]